MGGKKKHPVKGAHISQLKLQLHNVLENLKKLEEIQSNFQNLSQHEIGTLSEQTNTLLQQLEQAPLEQLASAVEKRHNKRKSAGKRQRRPRVCITATANKATVDKPASTNAPPDITKSTVVAVAALDASHVIQKPHQRLLNYHDAQHSLRAFELLKILHQARSQDTAATCSFAAQFQQLRAVWNNVLQENAPQRTHARKIEAEWNEVCFGAAEKTYYGQEQKLHDFLLIRQTWDSYGVHSSDYGSCIPRGWVLPVEQASAAWQAYLK